MGRLEIPYKLLGCALLFSVLALAGCSGEDDSLTRKPEEEMQASEEEMQTSGETGQAEKAGRPEEAGQAEEASMEDSPQIAETAEESWEEIAEPVIEDVDWSNYFGKMNGAAVIYDSTENCYQIYNQELADTRRSPCSTFKIISSLIALENGIIEPEASTRTWSGESFWNKEWNRDIDFPDAFRASCVWYFREVIDAIGKEAIQEELERLAYGNCDISDWEGRLNTNNNNPALTGFWIESSLLISPREQAEVMAHIFGDDSDYSKETVNQLKQVMLLPKQEETDISVYGKTGMGKAHGVVVDSWFTGFAESADKRIFFCVYLGETENENVSSARAKEIAINIVDELLDK